MAPILEAVFATLLMNDAYLPGAMVLGHSLRDKGAKGKLIVLVTLDTVSGETITELKTVYDEIVPVNKIVNKSPANLYIMNRPDLISTFTKIELWRQIRYRRIVYIDADVVALRAPNELLNLDTDFAAVPDIGWPDCFNSGVMVLNPNLGDYYSLLALAQRGVSFDGADQGLLNMHFRDWERLSFTYNCTPSGNYQYIPAYRHFQSSINMVHFIGADKPWTLGRENRYSSGVYGELLGMWWSVYDRHYRVPKTAYYSGQYGEPPKKVQEYVKGEETTYLPGYSQGQPESASAPPPTVHIEAPTVHVEAHSEQPAPAIEQSMGDQPTPSEQVLQDDFKPISTVEVRRFSAPHVEWEPSRAPPPTDSKPEASNFPNQVYDMSADTSLFQPPSKYPEPPKDMWYQVPEKAPEQPKPKPIFPWEENVRKPTRVFPTYKAPSPPPVIEPEPVETAATEAAGATEATEETPTTPPVASPDPWSTFQQRTNAWDDMPEIERYVQSFNQSRKGKIQVLHHTPGEASGTVTSLPAEGRRPSVKLTDFPTEFERPSLPVTPAPIRRPSFWGEERDQAGELPAAEGVPKQEEWVRRFSSYSKPAFPVLSHPLHELQGAIESAMSFWRCQYCGKQNPIVKLEELQRRQSKVLEGGSELEAKDLPTREMPGSKSQEEVKEKAISPDMAPKMPKPILKEPKFEFPYREKSEAEGSESNEPESKGPSFNPITLVGEAASESRESAATTV